MPLCIVAAKSLATHPMLLGVLLLGSPIGGVIGWTSCVLGPVGLAFAPWPVGRSVARIGCRLALRRFDAVGLCSGCGGGVVVALTTPGGW